MLCPASSAPVHDYCYFFGGRDNLPCSKARHAGIIPGSGNKGFKIQPDICRPLLHMYAKGQEVSLTQDFTHLFEMGLATC